MEPLQTELQIDDDGHDELNMELSRLARLSPKEIE